MRRLDFYLLLTATFPMTLFMVKYSIYCVIYIVFIRVWI